MRSTQDAGGFVGFGFGAIQSGLFLYEAHQANPLRRKTAAEVIPAVVEAILAAHGKFQINIAHHDRIEQASVENLGIYNPHEADGRSKLVEALEQASEIATALPSVDFYSSAAKHGVDYIIAQGLARKIKNDGVPAIIYTAENHNQAAEILEEKVMALMPARLRDEAGRKAQFVNTVIGKMSQVIRDTDVIASRGMAPITPRLPSAFLVEAFHRILITRIQNADSFQRGIPVFEEKDDLLRFEEAKLYGHNAAHALIGYLSAMRGVDDMANIPRESGILAFAEHALLQESGEALIRKYRGSDLLFTPSGYRAYVSDLLRRMTNPYLNDAIERVTRGTTRKLAWDDRLIGTVRLALGQGIFPRRYLVGAAAALVHMDSTILEHAEKIADILLPIWDQQPGADGALKQSIIGYLKEAALILKRWVGAGYKNLPAFLEEQAAK